MSNPSSWCPSYHLQVLTPASPTPLPYSRSYLLLLSSPSCASLPPPLPLQFCPPPTHLLLSPPQVLPTSHPPTFFCVTNLSRPSLNHSCPPPTYLLLQWEDGPGDAELRLVRGQDLVRRLEHRVRACCSNNTPSIHMRVRLHIRHGSTKWIRWACCKRLPALHQTCASIHMRRSETRRYPGHAKGQLAASVTRASITRHQTRMQHTGGSGGTGMCGDGMLNPMGHPYQL